MDKLAEGTKFTVLMLDKAAGISTNAAAIEDVFPVDFYLDCINAAYGIAFTEDDLPADGSAAIKGRVKRALKEKHSRDFDGKLVLGQMLKRFDKWEDAKSLPEGTAERAARLFKAINRAFE